MTKSLTAVAAAPGRRRSSMDPAIGRAKRERIVGENLGEIASSNWRTKTERRILRRDASVNDCGL